MKHIISLLTFFFTTMVFSGECTIHFEHDLISKDQNSISVAFPWVNDIEVITDVDNLHKCIDHGIGIMKNGHLVQYDSGDRSIYDVNTIEYKYTDNDSSVSGSLSL